jgi:hypothetical protein
METPTNLPSPRAQTEKQKFRIMVSKAELAEGRLQHRAEMARDIIMIEDCGNKELVEASEKFLLDYINGLSDDP